MWNFDGAHKKKKEVNLGGASKTQGRREELLQQARIEREQRETERTKLKAVITLQTTCRAFLSRNKLKSLMRSRFHELSKASSPDTLPICLHMLAQCYTSKIDSDALADFAVRIATFEGSGPRSALDALQTQFYAEDLASLIPNIRADSVLLDILLIYSSVSAWPEPRFHRAFLKVFDHGRIARVLAECLMSSPPSDLCAKALAVIRMVFSSTLLSDTAIDTIIMVLIAKPLNPDQLKNLALSMHGMATTLFTRASTIASHLDPQASSFFVLFLAELLYLEPRLYTSPFIGTMGILIPRCPNEFFGIHEVHDEDDNSEVTVVTQSATLSPLWNRGVFLFELVGRFAPLMETTVDDAVLVFSQFLAVLLTRLSRSPSGTYQRIALLNQVAFRSLFIVNMWRAITNNPDYSSRIANAFSTMDKTDRLMILALQFFADCYAYNLAVVDDLDFLNQEDSETAFKMSELRAMIAVFKRLLTYLYITPTKMTSELTGLREGLTKLFSQLHSRDCRCRFMEGFDWMEPSLSLQHVLPAINPEIFSLSTEELQDVPQLNSLDFIALRMLKKLPFMFPFADRALLFHQLISFVDVTDPFLLRANTLNIRRTHLYQDAFDQLFKLGKNLRAGFRISMIDEHGIAEPGIDGGGVTREFLTEVLKKGFDPDAGFFKLNADGELYPNALAASINSDFLSHFHFLGQIVGVALFRGMLMEVPFAGFFLSKLIGMTPMLNDLRSLDPDLHKQLLWLRTCENVEDLELYFSVEDENFENSMSTTKSLIPNGINTRVTRENKFRYIYALANYKLNIQIKAHCQAFVNGVSDLVDLRWLQLFDEKETQELISGGKVAINTHDLEDNAVYQRYRSDDVTIQLFWKVVHEFSQEQKRQLLKFVTSCSGPPLLGFQYLNPKFAIADAGTETDRLPSASTCMNLLKLPRYLDEDTLREKLAQAIQSSSGFGLS